MNFSLIYAHVTVIVWIWQPYTLQHTNNSLGFGNADNFLLSNQYIQFHDNYFTSEIRRYRYTSRYLLQIRHQFFGQVIIINLTQFSCKLFIKKNKYWAFWRRLLVESHLRGRTYSFPRREEKWPLREDSPFHFYVTISAMFLIDTYIFIIVFTGHLSATKPAGES